MQTLILVLMLCQACWSRLTFDHSSLSWNATTSQAEASIDVFVNSVQGIFFPQQASGGPDSVLEFHFEGGASNAIVQTDVHPGDVRHRNASRKVHDVVEKDGKASVQITITELSIQFLYLEHPMRDCESQHCCFTLLPLSPHTIGSPSCSNGSAGPSRGLGSSTSSREPWPVANNGPYSYPSVATTVISPASTGVARPTGSLGVPAVPGNTITPSIDNSAASVVVDERSWLHLVIGLSIMMMMS